MPSEGGDLWISGVTQHCHFRLWAKRYTRVRKERINTVELYMVEDPEEELEHVG
jgi:hypothetical protein